MAEVLHDFGILRSADETAYHVRACGAEMDDTMWQGWLEFEPADGGETIRTPRETTQPNKTDTVYWATGLTAVYIEGALQRALNPFVRSEPDEVPPPAFDEPAPPSHPRAAATSILDPFSVYRKGEALLRDQLGALSPWHLVNIINAYDLSTIPTEDLNTMTSPELIELIVASVRISLNQTAR